MILYNNEIKSHFYAKRSKLYVLQQSLRVMQSLELSKQTDGQDTGLADTLNNYTWWTDYSCSFIIGTAVVNKYIAGTIIKLCLISSAIHIM